MRYQSLLPASSVSKSLKIGDLNIRALAVDVEHFSSKEVTVVPRQTDGSNEYEAVHTPPIESDPPEHAWSKRLILPAFSPQAVAPYEATTRELCRSLIARFEKQGRADAAVDYAQQIPVRVIALMLGIPTEMSDTFTGWVRDILEFAGEDPEGAARSRSDVFAYLDQQIHSRRDDPHADLISRLRVRARYVPAAAMGRRPGRRASPPAGAFSRDMRGGR